MKERKKEETKRIKLGNLSLVYEILETLLAVN